MLLASLLLAAAPALSPVIADPRRGPSGWQVVRAEEIESFDEDTVTLPKSSTAGATERIGLGQYS